MTDGLAPAHLIDTNILLRISRRDDPDHAVVDRAIATLAEVGVVLMGIDSFSKQQVTVAAPVWPAMIEAAAIGPAPRVRTRERSPPAGE